MLLKLTLYLLENVANLFQMLSDEQFALLKKTAEELKARGVIATSEGTSSTTTSNPAPSLVPYGDEDVSMASVWLLI